MAVFTIPSTVRSSVTPITNDDYVFTFNPTSWNGISGTYTVDLNGSTGGVDKLIGRLVNAFLPGTTDFAAAVVIPNISTTRVNGDGTIDLEMLWEDARPASGGTPIKFVFTNFKTGEDQFQLHVVEGTQTKAILSLNPEIMGASNAVFWGESWVLDEYGFNDLDEAKTLFAGSVELTSGDANGLAALQVDLSNLYARYASNFVGFGTQAYRGPSALELELGFSSAAFASAPTLDNRISLLLPKSHTPQTGTTIPEIEYEVRIDPKALGAVSLTTTGTGHRNWWDSVGYNTDVGIDQSGLPKLLRPDSTGITLSVGGFTTGGQDATVKVDRYGKTDYFNGFENFELTAANDTVRIGFDVGSNNVWSNTVSNLALLDGNDTVLVRLTNSANSPTMLQLDHEDYWGLVKRGVIANLSGTDIHVSGRNETLISRNDATLVSGSISDPYSGTDLISFELDSAFTRFNDQRGVHFSQDGTRFRDTFHYATDGLGVVSTYRLEGSAGIDLVRMNYVASPVRDYLVRDPAAGQGAEGVGRLLSDPRFSVPMSLEVVFDSIAGSDAFRVARLLRVTGADATLTREQIGSTVVASGESVVSFDRKAGLHDAFSIFVEDGVGSVTAGKRLVLDTPLATSSNPDSYGWVDRIGSYASGASIGGAALHREYQWFARDNDVDSISYFNGIVDKRGQGFDRIVEEPGLAVVGRRQYSLTDGDDYIEQSGRIKSAFLQIDGGRGADEFYYVARTDDANQHVEFNLNEQWGNNSSDGAKDIVDIDLSRISAADKSAQYLYIRGADALDQVRFINLDTSKFRIEGRSQGTLPQEGMLPNSPSTTMQFKVFALSQSSTEDAILNVQVNGNGNGWDSAAALWVATPPTGSTFNTSSYISDSRSAFGTFTPISMTNGNDEALVLENNIPLGGPLRFLGGDDYVIAGGGDADIALGAGNDFISIRNTGQQMFISGGAGHDVIGLAGGVVTDANGSLVATDWSFGSISVASAQELLRAKYPLAFTTTADIFEWDNGQLDRVTVATNRLDGTTLYLQAEEFSFQSGDRAAVGAFLPPIEESYDFRLDLAQIVNTDPRRVTAIQNVFGRRATEDTLTLNVNNVDEALKHVGTWLDATTTVLTGTTGILGGSHSLVIKAETAATKWFSTGRNYLAAQFNLVDIENIRLVDNSGADVTIRVAGSNGFQSVGEAVARANRGDVIFVAEHRENGEAAANGSRTAINMDNTVAIDAGLRVVFEEDANRTVNRLATGVVNEIHMTESVKTGVADTTAGDLFEKHGGTRLLEVLGSANVNIIGSSLNDFIIGNKGNNTIEGRGGNDLIFGGYGSDILLGQSGNDIVIGGSSARVHGLSHTPDEGVLTLSDPTSFRQFTLNGGLVADAILRTEHGFQTGDKLAYTHSGGTAASITTNGTTSTVLTATSPLFAIADGPSHIKLATSLADALAGKHVYISSVGSATTHALTLDSGISTAARLAGSDFAVGGSGDDIMVAVGVTGSLTTATVKDTLTLSGGSGNDRFDFFAATGQINVIGGSGQDTFTATHGFSETMTLNGSARVFDFSATQDLVRGSVDVSDLLSGFSLEGELERDGLKLSQLVSPPLPLVDGTGEDGNYQEIPVNPRSPSGAVYSFDGVVVNLQDLLNQHQAHAA